MFGVLCNRNNTMPAHAQNALHRCWCSACCVTGTIRCRHMHRMLCTALPWRRSVKRPYVMSAANCYGICDCCFTMIAVVLQLVCSFVSFLIYQEIMKTCVDEKLCKFLLMLVKIEVFSSTKLTLNRIWVTKTFCVLVCSYCMQLIIM